ncbi:hypothetical protein BKA93DRAFT_723708 [Sparassis latifolia]|uniref:Uncharacterized protein n=1 Tax=Sparassis crispa TaxID=139825 RepID=A0A401GMT3_9APHY|nr:hypothetical protein SCP_0505280 [Sparassis crispa]GBE83479.1 hypothetical protein SCP_0505280 [Sparassis crispa]
MPLAIASVLSSPSASSRSSDGLPFPRNLSMSDFEVEHVAPKTPVTASKAQRRRTSSDFDSEATFRSNVTALIAAKARPFAVSGRIPIDPAVLILFFRTKSGITHSLDFPIDIDFDVPPALDVLITACEPHLTGLADDPDNESLFYPPTLPLTTTLEIANHPILDAVRTTLFPSLPTGHYLTAIRDRLEICLKGNRILAQPRPNDSRVATIIVTLPVRYRGGALVVRNAEAVERFYGRGGKSGDLEWTAIMADCDYEVECVQKGCRVTISYAVQLRSFGPAGLQPDPLISPGDKFLDMLSPILNLSRHRRIAFYLTGEYGVNPADVLAESLVPYLKGGDSILYHAVRLYKLAPELRWTAGGYVWPVDQTVEFTNEGIDIPTAAGARVPFSVINGGRVLPEVGEDEADLRTRVEKSGAIPLTDTDIMLLSDVSFPGPIAKERVPFVSGGEMEKLVVNVLLVVYVP